MEKTTSEFNEGPNVISLNSWKDKKDTQKRFASYIKMLKISNNHDLVAEIRDITQKLQATYPLDLDMLVKGKLLMKELSSRVENQSSTISGAIDRIKGRIEERLDFE